MTTASNRSLANVTWALALAVAIGGAVLHARLGPADTFWTIDNGGKALALRGLQAGRAGLSVPAPDLDPEYRLFPLPLTGTERYAQVREGRIVSQYLSPFVGLTVPFALVFGFAGLAVLPALGAGACVGLAGLLARRRTGSAGTGLLAAIVAAGASPLLFYAATFWEHALVGAFATGALVALDDPSRSRVAGAGALLGAACLLREEMALLLLAAVLVLLVRGRRRPAWTVAGFGAAGVAGLGLFHRLTTGSWTGVHLGVNRPVPFAHTPEALEGLLFGGGLSGTPWLVPAVALLLLAAFRRDAARRVVLPVVTLLLGGISLVAWYTYPGEGDAALALIRSNSALVFVPWVLVAPAWRSRESAARFHTADAIVALFVLLFVCTVPARSITGIHPGPRMLLLPLVPVFAATLAQGIRATPRQARALIPLLLVAAAWNIRSLDLLHAKREHSGRLLAALRARPERVVATPLFWLPTEMSTLWEDRTFLLTGADTDARMLMMRLSERGESSLLVADRPGLVPGPPVTSVRSVRFPEFSVDLHAVPLAVAPVASPGQ